MLVTCARLQSRASWASSAVWFSQSRRQSTKAARIWGWTGQGYSPKGWTAQGYSPNSTPTAAQPIDARPAVLVAVAAGVYFFTARRIEKEAQIEIDRIEKRTAALERYCASLRAKTAQNYTEIRELLKKDPRAELAEAKEDVSS